MHLESFEVVHAGLGAWADALGVVVGRRDLYDGWSSIVGDRDEREQ